MVKGNFCETHHHVPRNTPGRILFLRRRKRQMWVWFCLSLFFMLSLLFHLRNHMKEAERVWRTDTSEQNWGACSPGKNSNFRWEREANNIRVSPGSTLERAGATCCSCFETSHPLLPHCQRASNRRKNTPVLFRFLGALLLPFLCCSDPTCVICMSLWGSPNMPTMVNPGAVPRRRLQRAAQGAVVGEAAAEVKPGACGGLWEETDHHGSHHSESITSPSCSADLSAQAKPSPAPELVWRWQHLNLQPEAVFGTDRSAFFVLWGALSHIGEPLQP